MFVGLQGSGKTTSAAKLALHYRKRGWKPALICADTFRAGASDQLRQNALKIGVPFYASYVEHDPVKVASEGVELFANEGRDLIIVDTSGRHMQADALFDEMSQIRSAVSPDHTILVVDSAIGQSAFDQALAFQRAVDVGAVILTKCDGHAKGGGALSAVAATGSRVAFVGTGEHFNQLEPFDPRVFVAKLLGNKTAGLTSALSEVGCTKDLQDIMQRKAFTLRDYGELLRMSTDTALLGNVLGSLPMTSPETSDAARARVWRQLVILDSMNDAELDAKEPNRIMTPQRIARISRGSGRQTEEVRALLDAFKKTQNVQTKARGLKLDKRGNMAAMSRNPKQAAQQLSRMVDPSALRSMGGAAGLMQLMQQAGN